MSFQAEAWCDFVLLHIEVVFGRRFVVSAQRCRSFNLLIQILIALFCLETHQRVREGLHGVPDLHHWDLAGSDEGVRVQEVAGFGGCPGIMVQPEKVRAAIQRFSLVWELEHFCLLTECGGAGN